MDARKSGLTVKPVVLKQDAKYDGRIKWRDFKNGKTDGLEDRRMEKRRPAALGSFIVSGAVRLILLGLVATLVCGCS